MPFLNPPDVLPEAMRFILRALLARGGTLPEEELLQLVSPLGLTEAVAGEELAQESGSGRPSNAKRGGRTIAEKSLAALRGVQLVEQERGGSRSITLTPLSEDRFGSWELVTAPAFAAFLRDTVLASVTEFDDMEDDGTEGESGGAEDLAAAVALLFSIPGPLQPLVTFEAGKGKSLYGYQTEQLGGEISKWIVRNRERYLSLVRWVTYLEFGRVMKGELVVDPSGALRSLVVPLLDQEILVGDFLERIASVMPYSDRGRVGITVHARLATPPGGDQLAPGLALGMQVLHARGEIRLSRKSDAESVGFPTGTDGALRYSHIAPGSAS